MMSERYSEPLSLQRLWKAIELIRNQRQIANITRISRLMQKEYGYSHKQILHHIHRAVKDNMIVETISMGCKGSKAGIEQEGYWIPAIEKAQYNSEEHDWYCFVCHRPGTMVQCSGCILVYHVKCIEKTFKSGRKSKQVQHYCKFCQLKKKNVACNVSKEELNICLKSVVRLAKETNSYFLSTPDKFNYPTYEYFIKDHLDLNMLQEACDRNSFNNTTEFSQKIQLIVHNCLVLHGDKSEMAAAAKSMFERCMSELGELELCQCCYYNSNTKPTKDWFCAPCHPLHRVVWAKQKGFEYWPAKVMRVKEGKADVRFFGGHHERAWVGVNSIKQVVISPAFLHIKITKGWERANSEMKEYLRQAEAKYGAAGASSIVNFSFDDQEWVDNSAAPLVGDKNGDKHKITLKKRALKRQAEYVKYIAVKKSKLAKIEERASKELVEIPDSNKLTQANCSFSADGENLLVEWKRERKMIGEKAKLAEECARTWPYGSEVIYSGLIKQFNKAHMLSRPVKTENKQTQTSPVSSQVKTRSRVDIATGHICNCSSKYKRILSRYKACVERMRAKERNEILLKSAEYITRELRKINNLREQEKLQYEKEIEKLKLENKQMCQSNDHALYNGCD